MSLLLFWERRTAATGDVVVNLAGLEAVGGLGTLTVTTGGQATWIDGKFRPWKRQARDVSAWIEGLLATFGTPRLAGADARRRQDLALTGLEAASAIGLLRVEAQAGTELDPTGAESSVGTPSASATWTAAAAILGAEAGSEVGTLGITGNGAAVLRPLAFRAEAGTLTVSIGPDLELDELEVLALAGAFDRAA